MVSSHPISIGILLVDWLSVGPPGFGASHILPPPNRLHALMQGTFHRLMPSKTATPHEPLSTKVCINTLRPKSTSITLDTASHSHGRSPHSTSTSKAAPHSTFTLSRRPPLCTSRPKMAPHTIRRDVHPNMGPHHYSFNHHNFINFLPPTLIQGNTILFSTFVPL